MSIYYYRCEMPSEMEVEFEVAPDPLQWVRSDAHDTGALYVHTILPYKTLNNRAMTYYYIRISPLATKLRTLYGRSYILC